MSNRLLIVSNRLPVTAHLAEGRVRLAAAGGGLATGLRPWHQDGAGVWIGWPGDVSRFTSDQRIELDRELAARAITPVYLSREHVDRSSQGFANRVLWPLLHYLIDRVPVDATGWDAYRQVNQDFAAAVAREYRPGDMVWIHDYQLMLVPAFLRERVPEARIGFFLHVPFPSSEVFRILPWRRDILHGLLGADLIGFHTFAYLRHFMSSLLHVDGLETDLDRVRLGDREVQLGAFPMGVDAAQFAELGAHPDVVAEAEAFRHEAGGRQIVLGVDRLDYTKGIPRRLEAVARLLVREPELRDTMRYVQVAVPSRGEVDSYQTFRQQVEKSVSALNGTYGTLRSTPVHYIHRFVSIRELAALYRAADVMLVTPLRDGMNLVAKEFAASRVDEDGVVVLSEFAGAAAELDGAMVVNPYDVDAVAACIRRALAMPAAERRARMKALRRRVLDQDMHAWATSFVEQLRRVREGDTGSVVARPEPNLMAALTEAHRSGRLHLLLDYDGTLVPLARSPELAAPDDEVLSLIEALAAAPGTRVDIVSGRPYQTLEAWFGRLAVALWAEHGFWHRPHPDAPWQPATTVAPESLGRVLRILEQFTSSTPGSHIEQKSASVAWHYRRAQRDFGARQAHELRMLLGDALSNQPFEVLEGNKVIEVRLRGISKAVVAHRLLATDPSDTVIVAIGDDRTDEDLFAALPTSSVTVAVGRRPTRARYRVEDYRAVRQLLRQLLAESPPGDADGGARVDEPALPV